MWYTLVFATLVLLESSLRACCLDFNNASITDTEIVTAFKYPPRPASVNNLIDDIKGINGIVNFNYQECSFLDLGQNNIGLKGASELLKFILSSEGLPRLERLNLSHNRIRDWRGHPEYDEFEQLFKQLLERESFEEINLSVNYFGIDWFNYITKKFGKHLSDKITYG